jgi:hypothetical protein
LIAEWNPMVFLDLHGFVRPMLIEPCSPPHNPNYEYDLYIESALAMAEAMEKSVFENTGYSAQIPFRDWDFSQKGYYWDDWPPIYTPMFAMYHGAFGHTLETPYDNDSGVEAHYWAVWGAMNYVVENKDKMIRDQIEIFRRGFLDLPQSPIPAWVMEKAAYPEFEELDIFLQEFPAAYVIPVDGDMQLSPHQPAKLVQFLLDNDVQVEKAAQSFMLNGMSYPKGTYVVWLDQPKRGLANTILEKGLDVSDLGIADLVFYSPPTAWSHPLMWGVYRAVMKEKMPLKTISVNKAISPKGVVESGGAGAYAYLATSVAAFQATNSLLEQGAIVQRSAEPFTNGGRDFGAGTFIIPAQATLVSELANKWALELYAIDSAPESAVRLFQPKVAIYADEGVRYALETLGFPYETVSRSDLNAGAIAGFDLFLNRNRSWGGLSDDGKAHMQDFFEAGGDYIGLKTTGIDFAVDAGLINAQYKDSYDPDAIVQMDYNPMDSVAAGFRQTDYAYVLGLAWFTDLPADAVVTATLASPDFLTAGFWPDWQGSNAAGMPVIVHRSEEEGNQDTVLIAVASTFRGHPENTFRLIGNAIFTGID